MKRRILTFFAALTIALALLPGCGRKEPAEAVVTAEPSATIDPHAGQIEVYDGYGGTMWVDEAKELDPFPLRAESFSVVNDRVTYSGTNLALRTGVDVSDHQGEIDWQAVADAGIDFAIIRCGWRGYSAGGLNEDTYFRRNIEGAQAAGLDVGVYFFSQATSLAEGAEEAVYTLKLLEGYDLQLPVWFDWERIDTDTARTDDTPGSVVTDACLIFCEILESEGYEAGVYTYLNLAYYTYELDRLAGLPFWLGDPGDFPEFYYDHDIWQYTFTGSVPGIDKEVDMNVIYVPTAPVIVNQSAPQAEEAAG